MTTGLHRLWKLPLPYALWLALPLQIIVIWVSHNGWVHYQRNLNYSYDAEQSPPFDLDQWRYFTQKELHRSLDRAFAPEIPGDGLAKIDLIIDRRHIGNLNRDLPKSGRTVYYPAQIEINGKTHRVKSRYVGDNHWHWLYPQKSFKIKTRARDPIRDRRSFNLKNTATLVLEDSIANQMAIEIGLMAPDVFPIKLFVNGAYSGVHYWQDVADESLLRRFRRMPGSIYSGDGMPQKVSYDADGVGRIYAEAKYWEKDASRNAEQLTNREDLEALIATVNNPDAVAFRMFADEHLNLKAYARFTALDRLLGGQHHDYTHNHKIYFDPYKGRFEPIEWDFAWWQVWHRIDDFDHVLYPLLTCIRKQPEFELAIQQELYALLERWTPQAVRDRIDASVANMRPALAADGFRDVRDHRSSDKLRLAHVHCAHFSMAEFEQRVRDNKSGYGNRHVFLLEKLSGSVLHTKVTQRDNNTTHLALQSSGRVGQRLRQITATTDAPSVDLIIDRNRNGVFDAGERVIAKTQTEGGLARFAIDELLLPGLTKTARPAGSRVARGIFALGATPLRYSYLLRPSSGKIGSVEFTATNAVTDKPVAAQSVGSLRQLEPTVSLHPWDLPVSPDELQLVVGPGVITINEPMMLGPEISVVLLAGTTLRLAPNVSMEFRGKVTAIGTESDPIRIESAVKSKPWGTFALHGIGTKGSRFTHCEWRDGSTAELRMVLRTGMVSIIDSEDIRLHKCFIGKNHVGDDALHFAYINGGEVRECKFDGARSDAFDMDICEGVHIVDCEFHHCGNDALDLMTSKVKVTNCYFHDTGDKGISVGEATTLHLSESKFERCVTGLEIKDSSVATVDAKTKLVDCQTGVNLYRKNPNYTDGGTIIADDLWVIGSPRALIADKRSKIRVGKLHTKASSN